MMQVQLDFFENASEVSILHSEVLKLKTDLGNLRRGLFSRHGELASKYMNLQMDYDRLAVEIAAIKAQLPISNQNVTNW